MSRDVLQIIGSAKFTQLWCELLSFVRRIFLLCFCCHCINNDIQYLLIIPFLLLWLFVCADHHRFVHSENCWNMFTFTKTVRFEMCWIDRSDIDSIGSTQSIFEYAGGSRLSSIHRSGISGIGQGMFDNDIDFAVFQFNIIRYWIHRIAVIWNEWIWKNAIK